MTRFSAGGTPAEPLDATASSNCNARNGFEDLSMAERITQRGFGLPVYVRPDILWMVEAYPLYQKQCSMSGSLSLVILIG